MGGLVGGLVRVGVWGAVGGGVGIVVRVSLGDSVGEVVGVIVFAGRSTGSISGSCSISGMPEVAAGGDFGLSESKRLAAAILLLPLLIPPILLLPLLLPLTSH